MTQLQRRRIEEGPPIVEEADYGGKTITVVTGYDMTSNRWPVHVSIRATGGHNVVVEEEVVGDGLVEALQKGFDVGVRHIDEGER